MKSEDRELLRGLLTGCRVLSLGVVVDDAPYVGLLPFVAAPDLQSVIIHASQLARHTRGLQSGEPCSVLIHGRDDESVDALQIPRVSIVAAVRRLAAEDDGYDAARQAYVARFPSSARTFLLADFDLYRLSFESGRLVGGFARAVNLRPESFAQLQT
jgi:hypothetical protein